MIIHFGKHRGMHIEDIPSGYLKWLSENCEDVDICNAAMDEYQCREDSNEHFWD